MMSSSSSSAQPHILPVEVWSLISDYTTSPTAEHDGSSGKVQKTGLSSLRCTSRALYTLLTSEEYYRARVIDAIKSLDELDATMHNKSTSLLNKPSSPWPHAESVGGYKNLFHILIDYAPLEGWYTLCDGWPWGFLVLMKFCDGLFCGEVISVSSSQEDNGSSSPPTSCQPRRIFEISFDSSGEANCTVIGKKAETFGVRWKSHNSSMKVKKRDVFRSLQLLHEFDDDDVFPCNGGMLFHISDILKNNDESNGSAPIDPFFSNMTEFGESSDNDVFLPTACDIIQTLLDREMPVYKYKQNARRPSYISRMKDHYPNGLLFEYLCGPEGRPLSNKVQTPTRSLNALHSLQPGFYVGKNTQRFHQRHLQNEIVKVRNHQIQYTGDKPNCFSSLFQEDLNVSKTDALPMVLDILQPNHLERISDSEIFTFVSGRKVTGDIHVPSGETSWIAITSQLEEVTGFPAPPTAILQDSQYHQVTNAWPGWKQLARPFFTDSTWKKGWLLELRGTRNVEVDEWGEGWKYDIEAQYVFWLPEERTYFILSKLSCHFGSYLWDT
jgi:hypothetical protein